jgi:dTDP-4-dehydrorhamnose reductase
MKIVITGGSGLLGRYLIKTQPTKSFEDVGVTNEHDITACYRNHKIDGIRLDVSDKSEVIDRLFSIMPDIIIHCAANGDVDSVENDPTGAVKSDLLGTIHLKEYCEKMKCKLITISTNAVYDGDNAPYDEWSPRNPINFYGKIKSLADDIIMKSTCDWMIIRPIFMYGWPYEHGRGNWVTKIIDKFNKKEEVTLVDDSYTQPTYAGDVAKSIWHLIKQESWNNIFNVAPDEKVSLYDFGLAVANMFELYKINDHNIWACSLDSFTSIAPRPKDTTFNIDMLTLSGFECSGITEGLNKMKDEHS